MKGSCRIAAAAGLLTLSACVAPVGPVEVTRFHVPEIAQPANATISIEPAAGMDGASLEFRTYAAAVSRELERIGYAPVVPGGGAGSLVAVVALDRNVVRPDRTRSPVSVGLGGSTGSYGSGVGLGIGFDLSGSPPEQVET
ncbi:MAG: DUF4136 domain-containing protein, partial [Novosphingobium sp.]|nr:DUF4136 domain-containing protein [Novosphingobium sp.]